MLTRLDQAKADRALNRLDELGFLHLRDGAKLIEDSKELVQSFREWVVDKRMAVSVLSEDLQTQSELCIKRAETLIEAMEKAVNRLAFGSERWPDNTNAASRYSQAELTDRLYHEGRNTDIQAIIALPARAGQAATKAGKMPEDKESLLHHIREHGRLYAESKKCIEDVRTLIILEALSIAQMIRPGSEEKSAKSDSRRFAVSDEKSRFSDKLAAPPVGHPKRMSIANSHKKDIAPNPGIEGAPEHSRRLR